MREVKKYTTMQLRAALGDILDRVRLIGEHAVISRRDKPLVYVVPAAWYESDPRLTGAGK